MITLRRWHARDTDALLAVADDAELRRWTSLRVTDSDEAAAWLQAQHDAWEAGTRYAFAVETDESSLLGHVVLKDPHGEAEVGYWTAAAARGHGVAPAAVRELTGWAFTEFPNLPRLRLLHQVGNTGSCRVALKAGYGYARTLPPLAPYTGEGHLHLRER
ncbi:GNAT family N-acetyltransferase [Actinoplanes sp. NPDC051859]|uniref:GNAT family N-acetyltransferase n=1 Tax=Actinoplanes sp. NPDC051859 TaxID=3363909 RepID=UPI0037A6D3FE